MPRRKKLPPTPKPINEKPNMLFYARRYVAKGLGGPNAIADLRKFMERVLEEEDRWIKGPGAHANELRRKEREDRQDARQKRMNELREERQQKFLSGDRGEEIENELHELYMNDDWRDIGNEPYDHRLRQYSAALLLLHEMNMIDLGMRMQGLNADERSEQLGYIPWVSLN